MPPVDLAKKACLAGPSKSWLRMAVFLGGVVLCQAVWFGPSLLGQKILLPLDLLSYGLTYFPKLPAFQDIKIHDPMTTDLIVAEEIGRRFCASEFRQGRVPLWWPDNYLGAPLATAPKYSPFWVLYYLWPSPFCLAWMQMSIALTAAVGAYLFFRRALEVGFWPAAICGWCFPLTGFFVFWQGFTLVHCVAILPWLLLATDAVARRPWGWGGPALVIGTGLVLVSGQIDVAGQVLLVSGLYLLWQLTALYGWRRDWRSAAWAAGASACAWALGFVLACPYLLPLVDYTQTGARLADRASGYEERPPGSLPGLRQLLVPFMNGSTRRDSYPIGDVSIPDSSAPGYAGLLASLVVCPLAFCDRRRWWGNAFWLALGALGVGWVGNVPGLVQIYRLPVLNLLSHTRFVFATSFAILALSAVGLEQLSQAALRPRPWFLGLLSVVVAVGGWCIYRAINLPEPIATQLGTTIRARADLDLTLDVAAVAEIRRNFRFVYGSAAVLCGAGAAIWLWLFFGRPDWRLVPILGGLLLADLLSFGYDVRTQSSPELYYPRLPALQQLSAYPPGRMLGLLCLPPLLNETHGLRDIRGYDAVDPFRYLQLLWLARDFTVVPMHHCQTMYYVPLLEATKEEGIRLSPVLDMLSLRYLIARAPLSSDPLIHEQGYWVYENRRALPRAYVPRRVDCMPADERMLAQLARRDFDPRQIAYAEGPADLAGPGEGSAEIIDEIPGRVTLQVDMQRPGLVVLSDLWDPGWQASVSDQEVPIWRTNYVLLGVHVPQGRHTVIFRYEPAGYTHGLRLLGSSLIACGLWTWRVARESLHKPTTHPS